MQELDVAKTAAQKAMAVIASLEGRVKSTLKKDNTLVTEADHTSNATIRQYIQSNFPRHSILSEEGANEHRASRRPTWIIDPLDGTTGFLKGSGQYAVHIAFVSDDGTPILGVVCTPTKLYHATTVGPAYCTENGNEREIRVSDRRQQDSIMLLSRKDLTGDDAEEIINQFGVKSGMQADSFGVKAGLIAEGKADLYINGSLNAGVWDSCAPGLILERAGGIITDFDGNPLRYDTDNPLLPNGAVCSNGAYHNQACELARKYVPLK